MRLNLKDTYWAKEGKHQDVIQKLHDLVPRKGSVEKPRKNRWLEKFRKATNCYYDLYNNGLCNRANEFRKVFGIASSKFRYKVGYHYTFSQDIVKETEDSYNIIIENALKEQGLI